MVSNTAAVIFELIWYKRNQLKFNENEKATVSLNQVVYKLKAAQAAVWSNTINNVNSLIRKENKISEPQEFINHTLRINNILTRFSKNWNSGLMRIEAPMHLIPHLTISTDFLLPNQ